ncbi:rhomboid family intramembrane serine protease [Streptomyces sp. NPDC127084]|uniref:rhomboid family intramembrane serine protease n=1 Tax=Streptomyces sp. NPDC127084 TaxID=3347133 RepID=UPI003666FBB2
MTATSTGSTWAGRTGRAATAAVLMLGWVALLWVLEIVDFATGNALDAYGVTPREPSELADILPAAFLHVGFGHVAANSLPLMVLGFLAALGVGMGRFAGVVLTVIAASGLGVWLTSPSGSITLGASGVVFGLFGYVLARGFVDRSFRDVLIGLLVAGLYGSILWGVLPADSGISWQAHLFGLLGGVGAAFLFRRRRAGAGTAELTV